MKYVVIVAGMFLLLNSCKKNNTDNCPTDSYSYSVFTNKKIDTLTSPTAGFFEFQLNNGNNLVFKYVNSHNVCDMVFDGGSVTEVVFEAPSSVNSFYYTDSQLKDAKCYYKKSCYCAGVEAKAVTQGSIKGTKLSSGKWRIELTIAVPGSNSQSISFDEIFDPK